MKVKDVPVASLRTDSKNARRHNERNIAAIKKSLEQFGQQKPIVIGRDGVVVAGNGTLVAAQSLSRKARKTRPRSEIRDQVARAVLDRANEAGMSDKLLAVSREV